MLPEEHPLNPDAGEQDHYCDDGEHHPEELELIDSEGTWQYPIVCTHPEHDEPVTVYRRFEEKGCYDEDGEYICY